MSRAKEASQAKASEKNLTGFRSGGVVVVAGERGIDRKPGAVAGFDDAQRCRELRTHPP